ncbi:hypothetical protein E2R51_04340 [Jeotgalibacillus sp. S-D1]|uniref:hypothetical protein n=1 Tax=Jeotgalibacillus sp. S-D1 TaxID=2552189 RepID=UPI0010599248|nr:hypothetical protein [Jeotgalibacillus sp. S-D1]TDL34958.1 hypothetical protein E2R51_04340 [Jeotgalibacillus sp. S-D1]
MSEESPYDKYRLIKLLITVIAALAVQTIVLKFISTELSGFLEFILYAIIFTIMYGLLFSINFKRTDKQK